ncbi:MAG TPA: hypothetical protein PKA98_01325 [Acidimicrobiales bacterium]|nr:hypothetical protein [Acidimicrobiales bacterium]
MLAADLDRLLAHRDYPSVSLLVDLDPQLGPWRDRLDALRRDAATRLGRESLGDRAEATLDALASTVAAVAPTPWAKSIAVYVAEGTATSLSLPVRARDRVVVDETFATRDVVHALNRSPGWWLLAIDLERPRLWRGLGVEVAPVSLGLDDHDSGGDDRKGSDPRAADRREIRRRRRIDEVAGAVATAIGTSTGPLVAVGPNPTVSQFAAAVEHGPVAAVRGPTRVPVSELVARAEPELRRLEEQRCAEVIEQLGRHLAAGRCAAGIDAAWVAAERTGGATLIVETGVEYPARLTADGLLEPAADRDAPGVIDDAVDELIEAVLARGGTAQLVPDGTLDDLGRVVLLTRHPVATT